MPVAKATEKMKYGVLGVVVGALVAGGVVYAGFMLSSQNNGSPSFIATGTSTSTSGAPVNCAVTTATATIQGDSMKGILENGQVVSVLQNYYACNQVQRGDIVVYNYPSGPIVKKVMALPGDSFGLKANGSVWNIVVNGKALVNSSGAQYFLSDQSSKMLSLYATGAHGVIPPDGYLILGNNPGGSQDSTVFGLVSKTDFTGKVKI